MNTKPIKRNENLVPISREHHATLLFCWKLKQGVKQHVETQRIQDYINWFWNNHLVPHFKAEEEVLFTDPEDVMVQQALEEHRKILAKINRINSCNPENSSQLSLELGELVEKHTRYEERTLFPYLEEKLSDDELNRIGGILHEEEHTAFEDYHDEFWVKEKTI
ncbi:hemerythrin domain-containing protein [Chryseobacterium sp. MFBS3-17]|uniref:hemerythrin domain-containing protein n=1 Tax=Chryseobacterium sp. MFBS3-17 TaxID=2886689 RepID=UPI001D0E3D36|nr:hemerythrin domain-containing protein [Chryseobacterium sp. MFBS3-17]MCC2590020.1 hemerythrin domain-containing protein [Chryseobacterium sp. MFBS3-17]